MAKKTVNNIFYFTDADEATAKLKQEGKKLEKIAKSVWNKYLSSYKPTEYVRTGRSAKAIKLGNVKVLGVDAQGFVNLGIELTWLNNLAYHDSWLYKKGKTSTNKQGHAFMLIGTKWHSKKLEKIYKKKVYRHTYWSWAGDSSLDENSYLDAIISEYEKVKDPRFGLEIQWSGRFLK